MISLLSCTCNITVMTLPVLGIWFVRFTERHNLAPEFSLFIQRSICRYFCFTCKHKAYFFMLLLIISMFNVVGKLMLYSSNIDIVHIIIITRKIILKISNRVLVKVIFTFVPRPRDCEPGTRLYSRHRPLVRDI